MNGEWGLQGTGDLLFEHTTGRELSQTNQEPPPCLHRGRNGQRLCVMRRGPSIHILNAEEFGCSGLGTRVSRTFPGSNPPVRRIVLF